MAQRMTQQERLEKIVANNASAPVPPDITAADVLALYEQIAFLKIIKAKPTLSERVDGMNAETAQKLQQVSEQFGSTAYPNPPMPVNWMNTVAWSVLVDWKPGRYALVYLVVENGIGIAEENVPGYTPTPAIPVGHTDGALAVDWFNEHILDLTSEEASRIVLSTMRFNK